jgi:hypothetical protein
VRSIAGARPGQALDVLVADGSIAVRVTATAQRTQFTESGVGAPEHE